MSHRTATMSSCLTKTSEDQLLVEEREARQNRQRTLGAEKLNVNNPAGCRKKNNAVDNF